MHPYGAIFFFFFFLGGGGFFFFFFFFLKKKKPKTEASLVEGALKGVGRARVSG